MIFLLKGSFTLFLLLLLPMSASLVNAQFNFFEQMFGGGGGNGHHHQPQDVPSDSAWYRKQWQDGILDFIKDFLLIASLL